MTDLELLFVATVERTINSYDDIDDRGYLTNDAPGILTLEEKATNILNEYAKTYPVEVRTARRTAAELDQMNVCTCNYTGCMCLKRIIVRKRKVDPKTGEFIETPKICTECQCDEHSETSEIS